MQWCLCVCVSQLQAVSDCYVPSSSLQSLSSCQAPRQPKKKGLKVLHCGLNLAETVTYSLHASNASWSLGFCLCICPPPGGFYSGPPSQHPPLNSQDPSHACKLAVQLPKEWHEYCNGTWCQMEIQAHQDEDHPQGYPREAPSKGRLPAVSPSVIKTLTSVALLELSLLN